ncbi:uncharacterized protein PG986_007154 [Apiospora aurea]|uniref:Uncharacterized protein n=1 Tax=Apiospora aurea TaxID=335848 RepID=A0ABR1QBR3_9PEZI
MRQLLTRRLAAHAAGYTQQKLQWRANIQATSDNPLGQDKTCSTTAASRFFARHHKPHPDHDAGATAHSASSRCSAFIRLGFHPVGLVYCLVSPCRPLALLCAILLAHAHAQTEGLATAKAPKSSIRLRQPPTAKFDSEHGIKPKTPGTVDTMGRPPRI